MDPEYKIRCFSELDSDKFDDEKIVTNTSKEQKQTEHLVERCFDRFEQLACLDPTLPQLHRIEHIRYLENSLKSLTVQYECLDSSRPWLVYWILNAGSLLNVKFSDELLDGVVDFLVKCRNVDGGFGGGPMQHPHLAPTYAAVNSLCIIGTERAYQAIHKKSLEKFLWSVREPNGAFKMHVGGEIDVRGAYCALSSSKLANFSAKSERALFEGTAKWIAECQTYEGGFGGAPGLEAHGGYSFCAAAALALFGTTQNVNLSALLRWTMNRQMKYEGGFQGRTNKLVDGCYSFWQGALVPVVQCLIVKRNPLQRKHLNHSLMHREALQEYILICCQRPNGGLIDKPGKPQDLYHTCYTLSGLAVSQHCETDKAPLVIGRPENEVLPTHPLHNIPPKAVMKAFIFFQDGSQVEDDFEMESGKSENPADAEDEAMTDQTSAKSPTNGFSESELEDNGTVLASNGDLKSSNGDVEG